MNWSYVAGLFDGEGSLGLVSDGRSPGSIVAFISLTQAEKYRGFRALQELAALFESEGIHPYVYIVDQRGSSTNGKYQRNYRTMRFGIRTYADVLYVLRKMLPYLVIRKNSVEDMIRFLTLFPPRTGKNAKRFRPKRIAGLKC